MDVKSDEAGVREDPHATAVFDKPLVTSEQPSIRGQGQLFSDPHPTFADTDKIPAVSSARRARRPGASPWLRVTVVLVAVVVLAAGVALALVETGVIAKSNGGTNTNHSSTSGTSAHHSSVTAPGTPLVSQVSTGAGAATYQVDITAYAVTVRTTTGRSWVSIGVTGQRPVFEGILPPNSSQREVLIGASQVDVGAGGTSVLVTSGHRSSTLTPPSAPFSYQLQPKA